MTAAFSSASATGPDLEPLLDAVADEALRDLGDGGAPDLAVLFVTPDYGSGIADAGRRVRERTGARHLLGCTGAGVIGAEAEREGGRAGALLLARLPGVDIRPFALAQEDLPGLADPEAARAAVGAAPGEDPTVLLLPDPFTLDAEALLGALNAALPGGRILGGLASGATRPGLHVLWRDDEPVRTGAVGLTLSGEGLDVRPLVSQGCRPVGRRFTVTAAEGPRLVGLAGRPAAEALRSTLAELSEEDRTLARTSLHLGRVANEARPDFHRGDFLIRNLLAIQPDDGSMIVADQLRVGQTVQFQLRDAATATEDLEELLGGAAGDGRPKGGLLFSCGGRGSHLFGIPDHDLGLVRRVLGEFPLAGFFCNGEIGPVGPRSFLHGFTTSFALFS